MQAKLREKTKIKSRVRIETRGARVRLRAKRLMRAASEIIGMRGRARAKRIRSSNKSSMTKHIEHKCLQIIESDNGASDEFLRCMIEDKLLDENLTDALMERR